MTTNELPLAVLTLLGLYLLMPLTAVEPRATSWRRPLVAGLCCGLAAGLKPTAIVYPPALALALLFALGVRTSFAWRMAAVYALGAALAFLASYGPWGWHLYMATGNPVFPKFNQVFHSPLTVAISFVDERFRPRDVLQWLFYPFYWMVKQRGLVTEVVFADPRYGLATAALMSLAAARWRRAEGFDPALRLVIVFAVAGYVLWMVLYSILRYAVTLESLTGILIFAAVRAWWPRRWPSPAIKSAAGVALVLAMLGTSTYPDWWRGPYGQKVFDVSTGPIEPNSLVILVGTPDSYLAPMFPEAGQTSFVGFDGFVFAAQGHGLWDAVGRRLREHAGPRYLVLRDDPSNPRTLDALGKMLPGYQATDCHSIESNLESGLDGKSYAAGLRLCRLVAT